MCGTSNHFIISILHPAFHHSTSSARVYILPAALYFSSDLPFAASLSPVVKFCPMTRGPYRRAISFVLSWNTICNAQTTPKIKLTPYVALLPLTPHIYRAKTLETEPRLSSINGESSAPLVEMPGCANCRGRVVARDKLLFARASPTSGSGDNDSASVSPSSLSSSSSTTRIPSSTTSSSAATSSSSNITIDIPTIHSPVPMVAGSLAGFIAILAAVLVIIVVRRRKRQPMSRTTVRPPLPPFMGGTTLQDVEPVIITYLNRMIIVSILSFLHRRLSDHIITSQRKNTACPSKILHETRLETQVHGGGRGTRPQGL
ncbi:hypothetical protein BJ912DRAFT_190042 [Pholiota molesta]|nr:hypothetical protein BJ912DRAFT_190042 [Pholiota molesta]